MIESILYKIVIYCRLFLDVGSVGEYGNIQTQKIFNQKMWYIINIVRKATSKLQ